MLNLNSSYNSINIFALCLLHCLILLAKGTEAGKLSPPASDFNKHRLVQPVVHHGRTKRAITSTRVTSGAHHSEVTMKVPIDDVEFILDLQLNKQLITDNHVLRYQEGGKTVTRKPKKEDIDLCQYSGRVRGKPGSWVAVSTCHGVRGVIFDGEETRYIEPAEGDEIQSQHYVYDHSDLNSRHRGHHGVTNYTGLDPLQLGDHAEGRQHNRFKRATGARVRGPYNANENSRYVELVLVADHRMYVASGGDLPAVYHKLKDIAHIVNSVYATLNIFIALVGAEVWTQSDKIVINGSYEHSLNNFLNYRREELSLPNDNAQLVTQQWFDGNVIGAAYPYSMCMDSSGGINTNTSSVAGVVAITMAHEIGHEFGMTHDEGDCECPNNKLCIMGSQNDYVMPAFWTPCSLNPLVHAYDYGFDYCLRNKPKQLFDSPTCGNGFVEPGEQCDCGSSGVPSYTNPCHACCQPDTCMLRPNATCGAGACCDLQTCRPRAAGAECRAAERECDLPEYCTGHSEYCPDDVYKMDTTPCGKDKYRAYCVRGSCRSHASQCQLLWGPSGEPALKKCYTDYNVEGSGAGNCGYDYQQRRMRACWPHDALCGSLQCEQVGSRTPINIWNIRVHDVIQGDILRSCWAVVLDTKPSNEHFVMVPDGAICGHELMCMQQRCVPVEAVRGEIVAGGSSVCPSDCSGHGVCNSLGNCHCERGSAPPLCALPGPGGSYDSGPAADPTNPVMKIVMVLIYVTFLGVVPAAFLIFLIIYYYRRDLTLWWKRPRRSYGDVLSCGGCCTFTGNMKRTIVNSFQNASGSIRQLLTFKTNAANTYNTDRNSKNVDTATRVSNVKIEIKRNVTKTDGSSPTNKLKRPIRMFNKDDIVHLVTGTDDEHNIYANVQNMNAERDNNLKISNQPIHKADTQTNSNVDTTTYTSVEPKSVTRYDIDTPHGSKDNTKLVIVNSPIKVINNTNTQLVSDLVKASQMRLRPTPKPVLSKGKKLTAENIESTIQGNVSDIRRMFDTGNDLPCAQNSNVKVHGVKKLQTARFGLK